MDKVIKRESRDTEVREDVAKKWQPASLLPDFTKKAGWAYRWIRVSLLNENSVVCPPIPLSICHPINCG